MPLTYYDVLGLDASASTEEVERAFRKLARQVHPDLNSGDPARAEARMKELNEIRDILSDPLLRAAYDERLRTSHPLPAPEPPVMPAPSLAPYERRFVVGMAAIIGAAIFVLWPDGAVPPPIRPPATGIPDSSGAPLLSVPVTKSPRREPPPSTATAHGKVRRRGAVRLGSTAEDVFAAFGPPDRIETGAHSGDATLHYGSLRLEMKNGRVTGGDAANH